MGGAARALLALLVVLALGVVGPAWSALLALAVAMYVVIDGFDLGVGILFTAAERGLATLRLKAFRHIHDLSVLTQSTERRGSLVSRVTNDVDTISMFVQFGGLMLLVVDAITSYVRVWLGPPYYT